MIDLRNIVHSILPVYNNGEVAMIVKSELKDSFDVVNIKDRRTITLDRFLDTRVHSIFPRKGNVKVDWQELILPLSLNKPCMVYNDISDKLEIGIYKGIEIVDGTPKAAIDLGVRFRIRLFVPIKSITILNDVELSKYYSQKEVEHEEN